MLNYYKFFLGLVVIMGLLGIWSPSVRAQEASPAEEMLTVKDVVVDRTDKNAVAARNQAIAEAKRLAFRKLAARFMTPETLKNYPLPDDNALALLVQDFEIRNEQISAKRYVAHFTVRFNPEALDRIRDGGGKVVIKEEEKKADAAPASLVRAPTRAEVIDRSVEALSQKPRKVLVLPYFQHISGKIILWETENPWKEAWHAYGSATPYAGLALTVPRGDMTDLSFGSHEAVWSGDYSMIDKLLTRYNADEAVLVAANKSGQYMQLEIYNYKNSSLSPKKVLTPYTSGEDEKEIFSQTITQVVNDIQSSGAPVPAVTIAEPPRITAPPVAPPDEPVEAVPEKVTLDAMMSFGSFTQWLEAQKRLSAVSPSLVVEISSLSKDVARFTLTVTLPGGLDTFRQELEKNGLALGSPVTEGDTVAADGSWVPGRPVYVLRMN